MFDKGFTLLIGSTESRIYRKTSAPSKRRRTHTTERQKSTKDTLRCWLENIVTNGNILFIRQRQLFLKIDCATLLVDRANFFFFRTQDNINILVRSTVYKAVHYI